eukprot:1486639-Rhodomonas_salina.1
MLPLAIVCTPECLHHARDLEWSRDGSQLFAGTVVCAGLVLWTVGLSVPSSILHPVSMTG